MFTKVLSSSIDRLSATDWKTTNRPSSEMSGWFELPFAPAPPGPDARLTRLVVLATRSRTKMFVVTLLSSGDRLSASDSNTTKRPLPEIAGSWEAAPAAAAPLAPVARLTKMVSLVAASRTKTSRNVLSSSAEMLSASVSKATWAPFAEIEETIASASTGAPAGPVAREMRTTSSLAANAGAASAAMPAAARARTTSCGRRGERPIIRLRPSDLRGGGLRSGPPQPSPAAPSGAIGSLTPPPHSRRGEWATIGQPTHGVGGCPSGVHGPPRGGRNPHDARAAAERGEVAVDRLRGGKGRGATQPYSGRAPTTPGSIALTHDRDSRRGVGQSRRPHPRRGGDGGALVGDRPRPRPAPGARARGLPVGARAGGPARVQR